MKKILFPIVTCLAMTSQAQLSVSENGLTVLGSPLQSDLLLYDIKPSMVLLPLDSAKSTGISFITNNCSTSIGNDVTGKRLSLIASNGIEYRMRNSIHALSDFNCHENVRVSDGGKLSISTEEAIKIKGCTIDTGGNISLNGSKIILDSGFNVAKGGSLKINSKYDNN